MVKRQLPRPSEITELMRFKRLELSAAKRRLDAALTIGDLRDIARRRTPRAAFDYADGAAEGEVSIARARQAFEDIEFRPSVLRDVPAADRIHAPDAHRGRDRGCRRRRRQDSFHPVDAGHHLDRGRPGCQPARP
jgi:hypothetical protein